MAIHFEEDIEEVKKGNKCLNDWIEKEDWLRGRS